MIIRNQLKCAEISSVEILRLKIQKARGNTQIEKNIYINDGL